MLKEIKYKGYSVIPNDYECEDGLLDASVNMVPEDGALEAVAEPGILLELGGKYKTLFIHKAATWKNYIIQNTTSKDVYWVTDKNPIPDEDRNLTKQNNVDTSDLVDVNAVGNTLMLLTEHGTEYLLYKQANSDYKHLGDHIPDIEVQFGLVGHPRLYTLAEYDKDTSKDKRKPKERRLEVKWSRIDKDKIMDELSDEDQTTVTSQVMAKINKFIAEQTINKGRFCFPFLLRYALRLYDGSTVNHSVPILMTPSTTAAPIAFWYELQGRSVYDHGQFDIMLVAADIDRRVLMDSAMKELKENWQDIVKSIDVFISKPIYTYDQSGKIKSFSDSDNFKSTFVGKLDGMTSKVTTAQTDHMLNFVYPEQTFGKDTVPYAEWSYGNIFSMYFADGEIFSKGCHPQYAVNLPEFSNDKVQDTIASTSLFYYLDRIELNDKLDGTTQLLNIKEDYLQSLTARERLDDDYLSHDLLRAKTSFTYNNRINLSNMKRKLYKGQSPYSMFCRCTNRVSFTYTQDSNATTISEAVVGTFFGRSSTYYVNKPMSKISISLTGSAASDKTKIRTYIRENGLEYYVDTDMDYTIGGSMREYPSGTISVNINTNNNIETLESWGNYLFYPNNGAYKMEVIRTKNGVEQVCKIDLKTHEMLNGAYALLPFGSSRKTETYNGATASALDGATNLVDMPNKVYTSDVNNPFRFAVTNINTVGNGEVKGLSTAAKALSEGQFGQFPLYAFTSEGVWALEVNTSTGSYSARQPITRDVCINPKSITQIDSAVLFATDRGIMMISGSESSCISDNLDGSKDFDITSLQAVKEVAENLHIDTNGTKLVAFKEFIKDAQILYDYKNQRIIVYSPREDIRYAYIYSMKDKAWGMMSSTIVDGLNSYPDAYGVTDDGNVLDFSNYNEDSLLEGITGIIATRPLKLDYPDALKTIYKIMQRGVFRSGHVKQMLYGSRNLFDWELIGTSVNERLQGIAGTPYKYFRLVLMLELQKGESLAGCSVEYETKYTNKVR